MLWLHVSYTQVEHHWTCHFFVEAKYHLIKKIKEILVAQMHLNLESNLVRDTLFLDILGAEILTYISLNIQYQVTIILPM